MATELFVQGFETTDEKFGLKTLRLLVTSDRRGKTLSVSNDEIQFTFSLVPILKLLKEGEKK